MSDWLCFLQCGAEEGEGEGGRQRGSVAWDIPLDWDLDQAASCEASASKKRRKDDPVKGKSSLMYQLCAFSCESGYNYGEYGRIKTFLLHV